MFPSYTLWSLYTIFHSARILNNTAPILRDKKHAFFANVDAFFATFERPPGQNQKEGVVPYHIVNQEEEKEPIPALSECWGTPKER